MSRFREANLERIQSQPVKTRESKVRVDDFAGAVTPEMASLIQSMPRILAGNTLREAVRATSRAAAAGRSVIAMIGGHVIKTGCAPLLIQLMREGVIRGVAMNGAAAIHDFEVARFGVTSEDVEASLGAGHFGMASETSDQMNAITLQAMESGSGLGEALGASLAEDAPQKHLSILAVAHRLNLPVTVHVAIGTDIVHQHGSANGAAIGETSFRDFKILCALMEEFSQGVALNFGSAVILPEVFLKAFSVAANLGADLTGITTVNFDFIRQYRPRVNVVERPTAQGRGKGMELVGHHEILIPLFTAGVLAELKARSQTR